MAVSVAVAAAVAAGNADAMSAAPVDAENAVAAAEAVVVAEAEHAAALVAASAGANLAFAGGEDEEDGVNAAIANGTKVTIQGRYAAITRGFEVGLGEYGWAVSSLPEMHDNCCSRTQ